MISNVLTKFNRDCNVENDADFGEKIGNIGLGLLRIGCGKTVTVAADKSTFTERVYSTSARVAAIALFIFALPLTLLLAIAGCIGVACSKSHGQIFASYNAVVEKPHEADPEPIGVNNINTSEPPEQDITPPVTPTNISQEDKNKAATTIQKRIRGCLARTPHLPSRLYSEYRAQCENVKGDNSNLIPRAEAGDTKVYLPQEMPGIVLKKSGRKEAITRFHQMQAVRSILDSQHSSHLTIPKANLCEDFLIEQRLPINVDSYHNMGLYLSQPELFDEAVRELTRLFSRIYLDDLVDQHWDPLGHIPGVEDFVCYDNLPMYIVEKNGKKEGKIGLIDLEQIENEPNDYKGLDTLVRIFPRHLDIIKEEANKLKMVVNESCLQITAEKGNKYLQVGFTDHLEWLKQKDLSTNLSSPIFQISPQRMEELTTISKKELLNLNQGNNALYSKKRLRETPNRDFLIEDPEKTAKELAVDIASLIMGTIKTQIEEYQNNQPSKIKTTKMTESQLVSLRSPIMGRLKFHQHVTAFLSKNTKIDSRQLPYRARCHTAEQLVYVILEELVRGGEIFYFDPAYYTLDHCCWLRY